MTPTKDGKKILGITEVGEDQVRDEVAPPLKKLAKLMNGEEEVKLEEETIDNAKCVEITSQQEGVDSLKDPVWRILQKSSLLGEKTS